MHANCGDVMTEQNSYTLQLDTLELGEHHYSFVLNDAFFHTIEKSELLGGDVTVEASLNLRETSFDLRLVVSGNVQVTCDRCLEPMDIPVEVEETEWEWDEEPKEIDLAWLAYELIIVNLPLVHSHQAGGCDPHMVALLQDHLCTSVEEEQITNDAIDE